MFRQKSNKWSLNTYGKYGLIVIVVVFAIALLWAVLRGNGINGDTYQLIKLSNGESYVGKLSGLNSEYATLNTPFIYQEPEGQSGGANNGEIQLLRVSSVDGDLRIATDKIVYWGNLSKEGRVVNAIKSAGDK
jgi:hypothetical protein